MLNSNPILPKHSKMLKKLIHQRLNTFYIQFIIFILVGTQTTSLLKVSLKSSSGILAVKVICKLPIPNDPVSINTT